MAKAVSTQKTHYAKNKLEASKKHEGFVPCSQDMTICGDCEDNRAKKKCPRLKEWKAKKDDLV